ncbi:MAG: sigma-70 family RNA polymerase sigma factor [Balneolales bacterium]
MVALLNAVWLIPVLAAVTHNNSDERSISLRIKKGDHQAFQEFFDCHYNPLYRFLISRGLDRATAEDLIQKSFVIIWERRQDIDETKSLKAYLFRTAYTRMLNEIKFNNRFDNDAEMPVPEEVQSPEDHVQLAQMMETLHNTVASMPVKRRMVFDFCFLQQFTYKETAEEMKVSVKTIENHMAVAFKDIRKAMESYRSKHRNADNKINIY